MHGDRYPGPETTFAKFIHSTKHRLPEESFDDYSARVAGALARSKSEFYTFREILGEQRFLPAGRVQSAVGAPRVVTPMNCYVSGTIDDSMEGIMDRAKDAAITMKRGGGIGYDFSPIRPSVDLVRTMATPASGPVSFMHIFDATCNTVASAGNRRGAQMAVLRIDHPDVRKFIHAKRNEGSLRAFNMSVGVTDEFMECLNTGRPFQLKFGGRVYEEIDASALWSEIMRNTWDWAEPGVLFLDTINSMNPFYFGETISATNPCGEQPLPPYGACLLGSINLVKYVDFHPSCTAFNWARFMDDVRTAVVMLDRVIDQAHYPLIEQKEEHARTRRMGIGVAGLANAGEMLGLPYASEDFLRWTRNVMAELQRSAFGMSVEQAKYEGPCPALRDPEARDLYLQSPFIQQAPFSPLLREAIRRYGLRNTHLISIAPTGTIAIGADNVSGGLEPPFDLEYDREVRTEDGPMIVKVQDYAYWKHGIKGRTADELTPKEHLAVQAACQPYVDSAISKTINVGDQVDFQEFKQIYSDAWKLGLKGVTTFRAAGKRFGILRKTEPAAGAEACFIDPETGEKSCG